jgi:hypothetical protein
MAIANIKKNRSSRRVFKYLLDTSKQARILGGQVFAPQLETSTAQALRDPYLSSLAVDQLSDLFQAHSQINGYAAGSVRHISLGFAPEDGCVSDRDKLALASRLMEDLGYGNALWVAIDHHRYDPKHRRKHGHDHIHIVCHSLDFNGSYIDDYFDYPVAEQSLRQSEVDLSLFSPNSLDVDLEATPDSRHFSGQTLCDSSVTTLCDCSAAVELITLSPKESASVVVLDRCVQVELAIAEQDASFELS